MIFSREEAGITNVLGRPQFSIATTTLINCLNSYRLFDKVHVCADGTFGFPVVGLQQVCASLKVARSRLPHQLSSRPKRGLLEAVSSWRCARHMLSLRNQDSRVARNKHTETYFVSFLFITTYFPPLVTGWVLRFSATSKTQSLRTSGLYNLKNKS